MSMDIGIPSEPEPEPERDLAAEWAMLMLEVRMRMVEVAAKSDYRREDILALAQRLADWVMAGKEPGPASKLAGDYE
jgi:hypothetical protein